MLIVKFTVLFVYSELFNVCCANYCELCLNHTLCLFPKAGPSPSCRDYQDTSLLTKDNINEIVNRINERRNFVSLGLSKFLPQAANMRKISWSNQLAVFAQRWADQCDQFVHKDREDYCRDLGDDVRVGQNIATILGPTSGLNIKSFVDMWYMKSIDYTGSVTFYNQSRDQEAYYFTQLIWADTSSVGCGRAKFLIVERNTTAERLVCNFAPKGNVNGKPVYIIGYPATQCPPQTAIDSTFPALCQYKNDGKGKFTTQRLPVSSLLRILNLSNNSVKQEIDPIRSNLKQINYGRNKTTNQRYQKIRHVLSNNTYYGGARRISSIRSQIFWKNPENRSRHNSETFYQAERGHSRMYHGYQTLKEQFDNIHTSIGYDENFKKYDFTTEPMSMSTHINDEVREYNKHTYRCTRKLGPDNKIGFSIDSCTTDEYHTFKCTRTKYPQTTHPCHTECLPYINTVEKPLHDLCLHNKQITTCTSPLPYKCHLNCQCISTEHYPKTRCPNFRRSEDNPKRKNLLKLEFNHYDLAPNLAIKSDNNKGSSEKSSYYKQNFSRDVEDYAIKPSYRKKNYPNHSHQKHPDMYLKVGNTPEQDYNIYDFLNTKKKIKRDNIDQITFKPFWQVDQISNKNPLDLRSIKYTTLANRKNKKTRQTTTSMKPSVITEAITIKLKELSTNKNVRGHVSEKYLSFDELMHIRKMSTLDIDHDARRKLNEANILREDEPTTTVAPIDTPFVRKKHCTRKLTCTWTAFTATGIIAGGGDYGSKTPPGYVDGCTRTSTCTRDFQERNKISTIPDPTSNEPSPEDEDYCEKRSLNVHRRDSNNKEFISTPDYPSNTENYATTSFVGSQEYDNNEYQTTPMLKFSSDCDQEHSRIKRDKIDHWECVKTAPNELSYGGLYYLVLQKIIKSWEDKRHLYKSSKCSCNAAIISSLHIYTLFLTLCTCGLNE